MQIIVEKTTDISDAREACAFTMIDIDKSNVSLHDLYRSEHSPTRTQIFRVKMYGIASCVSTHFVRHKLGVEHFVASNRSDRGVNYSKTYGGLTKEGFGELFHIKNNKLFNSVHRSSRCRADSEIIGKTSAGYLRTTVNGKALLVHRILYLMNRGKLPEVLDHVDGDVLNNDMSNLRPATMQQNSRNRKKGESMTSAFKGVHWSKDASKWRVNIYISKKQIALGYFDSETEAAKKYDEAAQGYFGRFAKLNFESADPITRESTVNHLMVLNAQTLINMAKVRLCYKASTETRETMEEIVRQVEKVDNALSIYLMKNCEYRNMCGEMKSCGYWKG